MTVAVNQKCICQICTCGRCRCPHNRGTLGNEPIDPKTKCKITEYRQAYIASGPQPRRKPLRPPVRERLDNSSMSKSTTYNKTFLIHKPCANIVKKKVEYNKPVAIMEGKSTYNTEYGWKDGKRADSFMPVNAYVKSPTPFSKESVYRVNYAGPDPKDWAWCRAEPFIHKQCIEKSDDRFASSTTMKNDYVPHEETERVKSAKPIPWPVARSSKFQSDTNYNLEFKPKTTPRIPGKRPIEFRPTSNPFEGTTTARKDYQQHPYQSRRSSFKPDLRYKPSDSPMETKTTIMDSYKEWPIEKPVIPGWARQKVYATPTQGFEKNSHYQESYKKPVDFTRACATRPAPRGLELTTDGSGKTVKQTHYQEQFIPRSIDKPQSFKKTQIYMQPSEPMMNATDYKDNYKGEPSERAKPCTPSIKGQGTRAPFDFGTTYDAVYKGKAPAPCPAKEISDNLKLGGAKPTQLTDQYKAQGVKDGHHFFAKTAPVQKVLEEPDCTCKPVIECAS